MPPRSLPSVAPGPYVNDQGRRRRAYSVAYTTLGFEGSMTTSPAPTRSSYGAAAPRTFFHVAPASVVLYSPRSVLGIHRSPTTATYAVLGSVGCTAMRAMALLSLSPTF